MGSSVATGGVLQIGEPSVNGLWHCGASSPLSGPHGGGPFLDLPGTLRRWAVLREHPPACPLGGVDACGASPPRPGRRQRRLAWPPWRPPAAARCLER